MGTFAATDPGTLTERADNHAQAAVEVALADGYNLAGATTGAASAVLSLADRNSGGLTALTPLEKA